MVCLQHCLVVTWLVPGETAVVSAHSVYTMQPRTMSHHFTWNGTELPTELIATAKSFEKAVCHILAQFFFFFVVVVCAVVIIVLLAHKTAKEHCSKFQETQETTPTCLKTKKSGVLDPLSTGAFMQVTGVTAMLSCYFVACKYPMPLRVNPQVNHRGYIGVERSVTKSCVEIWSHGCLSRVKALT